MDKLPQLRSGIAGLLTLIAVVVTAHGLRQVGRAADAARPAGRRQRRSGGVKRALVLVAFGVLVGILLTSVVQLRSENVRAQQVLDSIAAPSESPVQAPNLDLSGRSLTGAHLAEANLTATNLLPLTCEEQP